MKNPTGYLRKFTIKVVAKLCCNYFNCKFFKEVIHWIIENEVVFKNKWPQDRVTRFFVCVELLMSLKTQDDHEDINWTNNTCNKSALPASSKALSK